VIADFYRNAGVMAVAEVIARLKGVLILPLLTRYLGTLDFGVWSQVSMVVLTLSPLVSLGTENGLVRLLPGHPIERQYSQFLGWALIILFSALFFAALIEMSGSLFSRVFFGSASYDEYITLAAVSLFVGILPNLPRTWLRLQNAGKMLALATVCQAALGIGAILVAIFLQSDVYQVVLFSLMADLLLGASFIVWIVVRNGWVRPDFSIIPRALRFGLPLLPAAYALWGLNWMDRLFLVHFESLRAVGIYAAAYGLGYTIIQVFVNPVWALYPNSAAQLYNQGNHDELDRLLHLTIWSILLFSAPAIAGMWALGDPIMALVAGPEFKEGAAVMWTIALAYLLLMLASFGDISLGLAYRQYWATVSIACAVVVNFVLNLLLIPTYGIMGAAVATLAAFTVQFVLSTFMAARHGPFIREIRFMSRVIAAAVVMGLVVRMCESRAAPAGAAQLAALVILGAMLYATLLVALRAVPPTAISYLRSRIFSRKGSA
jgi:O-antigen/teichoic acid export membrane protein